MITTGFGDKGNTKLLDGTVVRKDSNIINLLGKIDELQSILGVASFYSSTFVKDYIIEIERSLYKDIMASIAKRKDIDENNIHRIDDQIKELSKHVDLNRFILPYGTSSFIHMARAKTREVERYIVAEGIFPNALIYFNRLSDLLFILAYLDGKEKKELKFQ